MTTSNAYDKSVAACRDIFLSKAADYGTSWRVYRTISVVDKIYIKAWRIRQIQEGILPRIDDGILHELRSITNYGVIGLLLLNEAIDTEREIAISTLEQMYDRELQNVKALMMDKNHDYGEAWRSMSQESFIDLILTKLLRIKQILRNEGKTLVSEGIDANFADIINYAIFGQILIAEKKH